jgi:hypothetical protein
MVDFFRCFKLLLQININIRRKILRREERKRLIRIKRGVRFENEDFPKKKVTGTFIYHTPSDYPGIQAYKWKKEQWKNEFLRLKEIGIDTVIHNGAVAETTTGNWFAFYDIPDSTYIS